MSLLSVENLGFAYGARGVFAGLDFAIREGDRVGLIGPNGCGKSTLLRVLAGREEIDEGRRLTRRNLAIGYVEQMLPPALESAPALAAVVDGMAPAEREVFTYRAEAILSAFGFDEAQAAKPLKALSGGWRRLVLIARAAVAEPDLLLLDEPTNHLDLAKILRLEAWMRDELAAPFILVSHDRTLLDRTTERTLILREGRVHAFDAPCSRARELLTERDLAAARARAAEEDEIRRLEASAKRLASWGKVFDNEKFSRRAKSMEKRIDKLRGELTVVAREDRRDLRLADETAQAEILLRCRDLTVAAPDGRRLFGIDRLHLARGERLAILGRNASGKSTLLRRLMQEALARREQLASTAEVYFSPQARVGYFDQELTRLPADRSLFEFFLHSFDIADQPMRRELARAGFPVIEQERRIGELSGGERARLLFLLLKLERPNLLILDEPTNHLDIEGRDRLEAEILEKDLSAILVSHDRRLIGAVATRFLVIERGRLKEVEGPDGFYDSLMAGDSA
ncbi:MAG TPA: ABC-F family ATP-binding cassette domain-containing protein [Dongiaceae bacterium]|jgi:ATPase subunit of ABC transporter with duplicated ATPase domains|nr:ABC-F family ATP-binding cassette domain-containing protein [Dongiaceae bacterium]